MRLDEFLTTRMYWIYDFPNWQLCILTMGFFAGAALLGLFAMQPLVRRSFRRPVGIMTSPVTSLPASASCTV
jgi:hypothetical protein